MAGFQNSERLGGRYCPPPPAQRYSCVLRECPHHRHESGRFHLMGLGVPHSSLSWRSRESLWIPVLFVFLPPPQVALAERPPTPVLIGSSQAEVLPGSQSCAGNCTEPSLVQGAGRQVHGASGGPWVEPGHRQTEVRLSPLLL